MREREDGERSFVHTHVGSGLRGRTSHPKEHSCRDDELSALEGWNVRYTEPAAAAVPARYGVRCLNYPSLAQVSSSLIVQVRC